MTQSPAALATARRNVTQRIERFIFSTLEASPRDPTRWECEHLLRAIRALEELDYPRGEQAMMRAETPPTPEAVAGLQAEHAFMSTAELRPRFEQVVREIV